MGPKPSGILLGGGGRLGYEGTVRFLVQRSSAVRSTGRESLPVPAKWHIDSASHTCKAALAAEAVFISQRHPSRAVNKASASAEADLTAPGESVSDGSRREGMRGVRAGANQGRMEMFVWEVKHKPVWRAGAMGFQ